MLLRDAPRSVRHALAQQLRRQMLHARRVPRHAYRHYFIESEGLHSRVHIQNFYSTLWPNLDEPVDVRVELFELSGRTIGTINRRIPPFGALFLELRDALDEVGADECEGSALVDAAPPRAVLDELRRPPTGDMADLELGSPFWMAFYDANENYMYVHSISPEMGRYYGVPRSIGRLLIQRSAKAAYSWRAGRLLEARGLSELQIVVMNHASSRRRTELGIYGADDGSPIWQISLSLAGHETRRIRVDPHAIAGYEKQRPDARFRVGMDPLPTSNGKPYLLMRYADGPLSVHHG